MAASESLTATKGGFAVRGLGSRDSNPPRRCKRMKNLELGRARSGYDDSMTLPEAVAPQVQLNEVRLHAGTEEGKEGRTI